MKYVIDKEKYSKKLINYNVKVDGLDVNPVNNVENQTIKVGEITIVDNDLQEAYIKKRINRKTDKIIRFMLRILNDEDTTEDDSGMALDELNRLKGIINNKYKKYLEESDYKSMLTKLILIEEEFKKSYKEKILMDYNDNNYYEEEYSSFRGR